MIQDYLDIEFHDATAVIWIDEQGSSVNRLNRRALSAFEEVLSELDSNDDISAAVFISRKPASFIVGADLNMLQALETKKEVRSLVRDGHRLTARLQTLRIPTVAAMHGPAMGGGLEMALACTYRLCTQHPATKFALPEVKLGLLPAIGGTQRLPRLIGLQEALGMMLTGKNVYPHKAKRIGLVNATTFHPGLLDAALSAAKGLVSGTLSSSRPPSGFGEKLLESTTLSRRLIYQKAESTVQRESKGNYPAPLKILDCVQTGLEEGIDSGLQMEESHFSDLVFTRESKALVRLFFSQQASSTNPFGEHARPINSVGLLGAGLMGGGIAQVSAEGGVNVRVKDLDLEHAAIAKKVTWENLSKRVEKRILSSFDRDVLMERIQPVAAYDALASADLVIEAVPEQLTLKHTVLLETEGAIDPGCIFASNTSSIPISQIAEQSLRPENVVGMHYFSPVPQMPLLEIVRTPHTSLDTLGTAYALGLMQGKTPIVVNDGPGFYTTRILALYMNEALLLLEEGARIDEVDRAMVQWGFPMGPFALFDLVGIDVGAKITEVMREQLPEFTHRTLKISNAASRLKDAGYSGQKSNLGFFSYPKTKGRGSKKEVNQTIYAFFGGPERASLSAAQIQERLGLIMVNEALYCLEEGILSNPTDGDIGAVFGLGFPPFRGGPFQYVDTETTPAIASRLARLRYQHGARFQAPALLTEMAVSDTRFYS